MTTRRTFVGSTAAPFAMHAAGAAPERAADPHRPAEPQRPLLRTESLAQDSGHGPLVAGGVRFAQTIYPYPVCSPSRGSLFTGRRPHETGVRVNGQSIVAGMPTMGEICRDHGCQTVYGGKWHLPKSFDGMTPFDKLIGGSGQGGGTDAPLASACAKWLRGNPKDPFLMVASFMNPHDNCEWIRQRWVDVHETGERTQHAG